MLFGTFLSCMREIWVRGPFETEQSSDSSTAKRPATGVNVTGTMIWPYCSNQMSRFTVGDQIFGKFKFRFKRNIFTRSNFRRTT